MTLADIIRDQIETEGLDEIIEEEAADYIGELTARLHVRDLLREAVSSALRDFQSDLEETISGEIQEAAENAVADFIC